MQLETKENSNRESNNVITCQVYVTNHNLPSTSNGHTYGNVKRNRKIELVVQYQNTHELEKICYKKNVSSCQRKQSPDMTCEALLRTIVTPRRCAKSESASIISSLSVKILANSSLLKKMTVMKRIPRRRDKNIFMQKEYMAATCQAYWRHEHLEGIDPILSVRMKQIHEKYDY